MLKKKVKKRVDMMQRINIIKPAGSVMSFANNGLVPQSKQPIMARNVGDCVMLIV